MWFEIFQAVMMTLGGFAWARLTVLSMTGRILTRAEANEYAIRDAVTPKVEPPDLDNWELKKPPLSWPSQQILKAYQSLPAASQTYGPIEDTLRALDTKHGLHTLNRHFYLGPDEWPGAAAPWGGGNSWVGHQIGSTVDPWSGDTRRHEHKDCIGAEHYALWEAVMDVKKAIADQEKAIELAGVTIELKQVPTLLEALKIEAEAHRP